MASARNATLNFGMYSAAQCTVSIAHENTSSGIAASITNIVRQLTFGESFRASNVEQSSLDEPLSIFELSITAPVIFGLHRY